jgi:hypothetical protein
VEAFNCERAGRCPQLKRGSLGSTLADISDQHSPLPIKGRVCTMRPGG